MEGLAEAAPSSQGGGTPHKVTYQMFAYGVGWKMPKQFPAGTEVVVCGRLDGPQRGGAPPPLPPPPSSPPPFHNHIMKATPWAGEDFPAVPPDPAAP